MRGGRPLLDPADMQVGRVEVDLVPAKFDQLAGTEAVTEGNQDHGGAAMAPAVGLGSCKQPVDLGLRQVLASAVGGVRLPAAWPYCSLFGDDAVPRRQVDLDEQKLPVENGGKFQSGLNLLNIWRDL